jgi:hypothetical protein
MSEYIEKEALRQFPIRKDHYDKENGDEHFIFGIEAVLEYAENLPAADVAPVRHGRWIRPHWKNSNYCCDCSECGGEAMHRDYQWYKNGIYPICPNCGAKMDGGTDNG